MAFVFSCDDDALRHFWHPVALERDLCDKPIRVRLLGDDYVLARLGHNIVLFFDSCPHRGAPLSQGIIQKNNLKCTSHGLFFNSRGTCVSSSNLSLKAAFGVVSHHGLIWIALDKAMKSPPMTPQEWDLGEKSIIDDPSSWNASAGQVVNSFLSILLFTSIEGGNVETNTGFASTVKMERNSNGFSFELVPSKSNATIGGKTNPQVFDSFLGQRRLRCYYRIPFTITIEAEHLGLGITNYCHFTLQPVSTMSSRIFKLVSLDVNCSDDLKEVEYEYQRRIMEATRIHAESLQSVTLPSLGPMTDATIRV